MISMVPVKAPGGTHRSVAEYLCRNFMCARDPGRCQECVPGSRAFEKAAEIITLVHLKGRDDG